MIQTIMDPFVAFDTDVDSQKEFASNVEQDASVSLETFLDPLERQRELNDNLALIRILDGPSPFGEFRRAASEPHVGTSRLRRQTLLNFVAFCLVRDGNAVALAATIQRHGEPRRNRLVLHVAKSTGFIPTYEREQALEFLADLKNAWKSQSYEHMQLMLAQVVQMTEKTVNSRLRKLRDALNDLQGPGGFLDAVDAWGKQEASPHLLRWMTTFNCESPSAALKDIFQRLTTFANTDEFPGPHTFDASGQFYLYQECLFPISILLGSQFIHEVEFDGQSETPTPEVIKLIKRLRRRCIKLRWYETGVHLLCTSAGDSLRRILGPKAFTEFLQNERHDGFHIDWVETPNAVSKPMKRGHASAQEALLGILANISEDSDSDEPFACTIAHKPLCETYWTPTCIPIYHPEVQIADYLRRNHMRPSPTYIGGSRVACRLCKFYIDQFERNKYALYTGGLETMELDIKEDWLIPATETGVTCAAFVMEEAARLVLREDNIQRIAWEKAEHVYDPPVVLCAECINP